MITLDPPKQNHRSLKSLQEAQLTRLDWREIFKVEGEELSAEDVKAMDEYFVQFLKPKAETRCVNCDSRQSGGNDIVAAFLDSHFIWGLANGEGFCDRCKYPARAYHREIGPIKFLNLILQYHPDELADKSTQRVLCGNVTKSDGGSGFPQKSAALLNQGRTMQDLGELGAV